MNTKIISLLLIASSFHIPLISMKRPLQEGYTPLQQLDLIAHIKENIPSEVQQEITHQMVPQWWYLQQTFQQNNHLLSVCFDTSKKPLAITRYYNNAYRCYEAQIIDIQTQKNIASFKHDNYFFSSKFNPSGTLLVTISNDKKMHIFDIQAKSKIASLNCGEGFFTADFDHSSEYIATGRSSITYVFNIKTKSEIASFKHNDYHYIFETCFHPFKKHIATASETSICIFDMETKTEVASFEHNLPVYSICFNPSGTLLATSSRDNKTRIFDIETKTEIASFKHNDWVDSVSFSPCGKYLRTISIGAKKISIFDIETKKEVASFLHNDSLISANFDSSGKLLATTADTSTAYLTAPPKYKACIFARYDDYTLDQVSLKYLLINWLLIEKPYKAIDALEKLLADVAKKNDIPEDSLLAIWQTFPQDMQAALWRTMDHKIQIYGKK